MAQAPVLVRRAPVIAPMAALMTLLALMTLVACGTPKEALNPAQLRVAQQAQLASRALSRGDLALARQNYEQALAAAESVEDFALAGSMLINLAQVQARAGDGGGAQARLDRIVAAPQRYGQPLAARASLRKALMLVDQQQPSEAARWADTALAACPAPCELAATVANLRAQLALQQGDTGRALQQAQLALQEAERLAQQSEQVNALHWIGRAQSLAGQTDAATAALARALALAQRLGLADRVALTLVESGDNERRAGRSTTAREFYERALDVYTALGDKPALEQLRERLASAR